MRRPVPAGRVTALCLVSLAAVAGPLVVGHAAALPVASQRLTTHTAASQVATTTCTAAMSADSYVAKGSPDSNFGTETVLVVRADPSGADPRRSLVRADLSSCAIPTGAAVQSAQLALTLTSDLVQSRVLDVHRAGSSWTEAGVTWTTQPTVAMAATSSASTGTTAGVRIRWDVKADVVAFVAGSASNDGWLVRDRLESDLDIGVPFASREHATTSARPALVITYYP